VRILRVSQDVVPVGQFKAEAKKWLARAGETGQPLVITQNGRPAAVLLSPAEYDRLTENERFLASVSAGLTDAESGRLHTTDEVRRRLGLRRRNAR
jgi:prevent-host-death family protein